MKKKVIDNIDKVIEVTCMICSIATGFMWGFLIGRYNK